MKDVIIKIYKDSSVYTEIGIIGINYENLQGKLVFEFVDEFVDGTAYLEFKRKFEKGLIPMNKVGKTYEIEIKSSLLKEIGNIELQLRITQDEVPNGIPVYKSKVFTLEVLDAINATSEIPDEYPEWIDLANEKIKEMDNLNITTERVEDGVDIVLTDKKGNTTRTEVKDGAPGPAGPQGAPGAVKMQVVDTLPETGETDTIYLVKKDNPGKQNLYDEYVYTDTGWEHIGDTSVDLSDYYTKEESDEKLSAKQDELIAGDGIELDGNTIKAAPDFSMYSVYYAKPKDGEDYILINDLPASKYPSDITQYKRINILPTGLDVKVRTANGTISNLTGLGDINGNKKGFRAIIIYYNGDSLEEMTGDHATISMIIYNTDSPHYYLGYLYKNGTSISSPGLAFPSGKIMTSGEVAFNYASKDSVLTKTNTSKYTPTNDYNPSTKKYVDDNVKTYTAGDNIEISDDNVISANIGFPIYKIKSKIPSFAQENRFGSADLSIITNIINNAYNKGLSSFGIVVADSHEQEQYLFINNNVNLQDKPNKYWCYSIESKHNRYDPGYNNGLYYILSMQLTFALSWTDNICTCTSADIYKVEMPLLLGNNIDAYTPTGDYNPATKKYADDLPTTYTGYDATKTQVLKNINGTLTWVDE